jgi:hemoglobin-like flavoprotein
MYQQHIEAVENSLAQAKQICSIEMLADTMFRIFFDKYPEARRYFADYDLSQLASVKFNIIVVTVIDSLKFPDYADNYVSEEVYRHTIHDLKDREYYFALIDALIQSLKQTLAEQWTPQLEQYWTEAVASMKHIIDREIKLL